MSATIAVETLAPVQEQTHGRSMGRARRTSDVTDAGERRSLPGARTVAQYQLIWQEAYEQAVSDGVHHPFARRRADRARQNAFEADTGFSGFDEPDSYF
ncbi:MAG TPA: hypothetical protein VHV75_10225 [Solirubrobacteraceae bacterium]|nr:hypothetical protein [Solirubrobacteraceae bacterium]